MQSKFVENKIKIVAEERDKRQKKERQKKDQKWLYKVEFMCSPAKRNSETRTNVNITSSFSLTQYNICTEYQIYSFKEGRFSYLLLWQVSLINLAQQLFQRTSIAYFQRINDITQRLGHFLAVLVTHHRMQIDSFEWQLISKMQ
jgi:hypothetical protein